MRKLTLFIIKEVSYDFQKEVSRKEINGSL